MRFKSGFLVGLGAGYVLGTKAGQERYQQIVDAASKLRENPGVQRLTGEVNRTVSVGKDRVAETAAAKADEAKEAVASKVGGNTGSSSSSTTSTTSTTSGSSL
ncbi:MAG TPA: YtxH domain-containing protein [Actinomycetes bacterium]|nr:YtxH domain-containing protein [Actinomycetes bacterium]